MRSGLSGLGRSWGGRVRTGKAWRFSPHGGPKAYSTKVDDRLEVWQRFAGKWATALAPAQVVNAARRMASMLLGRNLAGLAPARGRKSSLLVHVHGWLPPRVRSYFPGRRFWPRRCAAGAKGCGVS